MDTNKILDDSLFDVKSQKISIYKPIIGLVKKYALILMFSEIVVRILTLLTTSLVSRLITPSNFQRTTFFIGTILAKEGINYSANLIILILLLLDMKKLKLVSIPILLLTFFSSWVGIIVFFLVFAYSRFIDKKQLIQ
jgi:hypothetical protein